MSQETASITPSAPAVDRAAPLFGPEMAVIEGITDRECEAYALPIVGSGQKRLIVSSRNGRGQWMKAKISTVNVVIEFEDGTWALIHPSKLSTYGARYEPTSCFVPARPNDERSNQGSANE